jgi:hypothetical protein
MKKKFQNKSTTVKANVTEALAGDWEWSVWECVEGEKDLLLISGLAPTEDSAKAEVFQKIQMYLAGEIQVERK